MNANGGENNVEISGEKRGENNVESVVESSGVNA